MGKRKLWGVVLIVTALVIMQLPVPEVDAASASDFRIEGSTLVKYVGTDTNVTIPDTVETIGRSAFEDNDRVERVTIPGSVKTIQPYAFWDCDRLYSVTLGSGLTQVGDFAFANCTGLRAMTIPESVHSIGIQAFADCFQMTDITIPPQVISIHETAFDGCYQLVIHAEEGSYADRYAREFYARQAEMPEYEDVYNYPGTDEVEIIVLPDDTPDSTEEPKTEGNTEVQDTGELLGATQIVGNRAVVFIDNTSPTVLDSSYIPGTQTPEIAVDEMTDGSIPKYTIVDGRIVADQAYYRSEVLAEVALPDGITEIGQFAFARSTLKSIQLPEGLRYIDYGAFYHCDALGEIILPSSVENVEPKAFAYTKWMQDFLTGDEAFLISGDVLVAYKGNASEVAVPEGVTVLAAEAFAGNTAIESVQLPDSLRVIGEGAFENCSALKALNCGQGVEKIKDRAFAGCALSEVTLPVSLAEQGVKAFDEAVLVHYEGATPRMTHETSAERLSNVSYRDTVAVDGNVGVQVSGLENAYAQLSGADRTYTLEITQADGVEVDILRSAFERARRSFPSNSITYDLCLYDGSGIPLTKLGHQELAVVLPIAEYLQEENLHVMTLDRNGQLEEIPADRILVDGESRLRFLVTHLSCFCIYGDGTPYDSERITEEVTVDFFDLSAPPTTNQAGAVHPGAGEALRVNLKVFVFLKWSIGVALVLMGAGFWLSATKGRKSSKINK